MGRGVNRLTVREVEEAKLSPGTKHRYLSDGGCLYLAITQKKAIVPKKGATTKSWIFRYRSRTTSKLVDLGLGSLDTISLVRAREGAAILRLLLADGLDPKAEVEAKLAGVKLESAKAMTFNEAAAQYIKDRKAGWKNAKHLEQWERTLETYASPHIGSLPVAAVDLPLIRKILDPIWVSKNETASRVRQRVEAVLGWATVSGYRKGENPARWKGHLDHLLPAAAKVNKVKAQPALDWREIGAFMEALRTQRGFAPLALEFTILTAARSEEVVAATPGEFDLDRAIWTIPEERMKAGKAHTVPLSPRALEIVHQMLKHNESIWLFPGQKEGKPFSNGAMLKAIKLLHEKSLKDGGKGWCDPDGRRIVPHGFRSTFRDWAGECSNFPREVIENALAHQLKDKAEAAYARGTQLAKRKALMDAWERFCEMHSDPMAGNVVPIRGTVG